VIDPDRTVPGATISGFGDLFATPTTGAAGWFGKMPLMGDFAQRRLPTGFVESCDAWLSAGMQTSRQQLGDSWLDVYLTGPIWRFGWAPGVIDTQWWFGTLMPSVDNVGRYFPLVVARSAAVAPESARALQGLSDWYSRVAAASLDTLRPGASLEAFEAALAAAPAPIDELPERRPEIEYLPGRERYQLGGSASLAQWAAGMGLRDAMLRCAGHSLWWPDHATSPDTSLSFCNGLPDPEHFSLLLEGRW
jgi:type VI secretion system protein ImpM